MRLTLLTFLIFILLIIAGGLYKFLVPLKPSAVKSIQINSWNFQVEIADSAIRRARGLSGRSALPENQGMLFLFGSLGRYGFWMKGMLIPLDIIWIKGDRVVWINPNVPADAAQIYYPIEPVDKVLEINAGLAEKIGIQIGQAVEIK